MEGLEACDAGGRRLDFASGLRSRGVDGKNIDASHRMERGVNGNRQFFAR